MRYIHLNLLFAVPNSVSALPQLGGLLSSLFGSGTSPQIALDYGTFKGVADAITGTDNFLGMPFATAGRLENPVLVSAANKLPGIQDATKYGTACPQMELIASPLYEGNAEIGGILAAVEQLLFAPISNQGEDCLNINVQVPQNMTAEQIGKLPVMLWIYGGGFELGSSAALGLETTALPGIIYQGANLVARSVEMGQPIVIASANYRMNDFGTLASQELTDAGLGNLLLKDQRVAMHWVQKYISKFGGDPSKVTLFGESAGSMSIAIHMLLNDGDNEGLFRAAIMMSGGPGKFSDYHRGQKTFDTIASRVGCGDAVDKIACLRSVSYDALYIAVQENTNFFSYTSAAVPWYPKADGTFLKDSPHRLLRTGKVAPVPYIIGDLVDEGTLFSLISQLNVTNDADFRTFFNTVFFPNSTAEQIAALTSLYPEDPAAGSPFGTGAANAIGPQYKRMAALVGDYTFQSGRRDLLSLTASKQPAWSYQIVDSLPLLGQIPLLSKLAALPILGSFHVSDVVLYMFGLLPKELSKNTLNIMSTFIAFANELDPNAHGLGDLPAWPRDAEEEPKAVPVSGGWV